MKRIFLNLLFSCCSLAFLSSCGAQGEHEADGTYEDVEEEAWACAPEEGFCAPAEADDTPENLNTNEYATVKENPFFSAIDDPKSTFSIDVDNASYTQIRTSIENGYLPDKGAVRIEEMVNYFTYDYKNPTDNTPFSVNFEVGQCPWNNDHKLVHIGLQGKKLDTDNIKGTNMVLLIDISGSMSAENKLPLLTKAMNYFTNQLQATDRVAIVTYAGNDAVALPSTSVSDKSKIMEALNNLESGGSTAGAKGIERAYQIAEENFIKGGNNRIVLCTDGDFNVGTSSTSSLVELIEEKRKTGIYLTICGFGMGNYKDYRMEEISNAGNGNYFYIDNFKEARKVFGKEMQANMFTIAKDVKLQVEFNPAFVAEYRLIGYENRVMDNQDFEDDTKDAGELGAGHTVTAIYEIKPAKGTKTSESRYQRTQMKQNENTANEMLFLALRYKPIGEEKSVLVEYPLNADYNLTSDNFNFSAAVTAYGLLLRDSEYIADFDFEKVIQLAKQGLGKDTDGYRREFIDLVEMTQDLDNH